FRMYGKLAGMTGTAKTEEDEFRDIYNMDVVVIPTNREIARIDRDDEVYGTEAAKFRAIANRIAEAHATGQPVLVGTISIENSERISLMLKKRGIKHNVLNAKQHDRESAIVAEAGRLGAVTIATNMAGRGTDIILGGNPEFEAKREMEKQGFTAEQISFATSFVSSDDPELIHAREVFHQLHESFKAERAEEQAKVKELGGLCIIGTERHESRRIDNQLRGRAGRQGDPGETQFFISLEDDLMRLFGGERIQGLMDKFGMDDQAIAAGLLSKTIENAQKKVEGRNFEIRKYVLQYDNVMNKQREVIYDERRKVLFGEDLKDNIMGMMATLVENIVKPATVESRFAEEWDIPALSENLKRITGHFPGLSYTQDQIHDLTEEKLEEDVKDIFYQLYDSKEAEIGTERMREVERMILLRVVDNHWMDHIQAMDDLKQGIGLRSLGHMDPAAAYANEGFDMFEEMIGEIQHETVKYCYNVTMQTGTQRRSVIGRGDARKDEFRGDAASLARRAAAGNSGMPDGSAVGGQMPGAAPQPVEPKKQETVRRQAPKVGRNDDCPCGSGKKYKNCCMKKDQLEQ
ncbi:MAG: SEC-C domain-containing protein, partial [Firmicutes bacterium]|nr:SEC-C domain-containing protein [Bacillota bacterium]